MNHWPEIWRLAANNGYIIDARAVCGERLASVGSGSRGGRSASRVGATELGRDG